MSVSARSSTTAASIVPVNAGTAANTDAGKAVDEGASEASETSSSAGATSSAQSGDTQELETRKFIAKTPSPRVRFVAAGVLSVLAVVAFVAAAAKPGEQPTKLIAVLSTAGSAIALITEGWRLIATRNLLRSPFSLLPLLGVVAVCAAVIVAMLLGGDGAITPLLVAAPLLATATMLVGHAWLLAGLRLVRHDGDLLFPLATGSRTSTRRRISLGQVVEYRTGDVIAADGRIQRGCLALDERCLSPIPVFRIREEEEIVYAGSVVLAGTASVVALISGDGSTLCQLQQALRPLADSAASGLEFEDARASRWSALAILFLAVAVGIYWHERSPGYVNALLAAGTVALFGSVCLVSELLYSLRRALVQRWVQRGYLLAHADSCKQLAAVAAVECDASRCGEGSFLHGVSLDVLDDRLARGALCDFLCALVGRAEDPVLVAVGEYCRRNGVTPSVERVVDLHEYSGRGVCGVVHGVDLSVGTEDFLLERGIMVQPSEGSATADGESLILVAIDDDVVARIHIVHDQADVVSGDAPSEWEGPVQVAVAPGIARTLGDETLLIRGRESDLVGQTATREETLFDPREGLLRHSTVVALTPELAPLEALLAECRTDIRTVDRFRLLVGFCGLMVLAAVFAGATTALIPLVGVAFVGTVVHLSHRRC